MQDSLNGQITGRPEPWMIEVTVGPKNEIIPFNRARTYVFLMHAGDFINAKKLSVSPPGSICYLYSGSSYVGFVGSGALITMPAKDFQIDVRCSF
jgi:hypothetical protein